MQSFSLQTNTVMRTFPTIFLLCPDTKFQLLSFSCILCDLSHTFNTCHHYNLPFLKLHSLFFLLCIFLSPKADSEPLSQMDKNFKHAKSKISSILCSNSQPSGNPVRD